MTTPAELVRGNCDALPGYAAFTEPAPGVSLNTDLLRDGPNGTPFWEGAVLRIEAVNRTVIYRIGGYMQHARAYIGEWPD